MQRYDKGMSEVGRGSRKRGEKSANAREITGRPAASR